MMVSRDLYILFLTQLTTQQIECWIYALEKNLTSKPRQLTLGVLSTFYLGGLEMSNKYFELYYFQAYNLLF